MKIVTVVGARPQFVKAAALSREFAKRSAVEEIIIHTGQHYDKEMSDVFFDELEIPRPNYRFDCSSSLHGEMVGDMLAKIEGVLLDEKPDLVLVYGDTNTTLAAALAAAKLYIKIAHVEAGIRSFNMNMPEEINRVVTDRLSSFMFSPTEKGCENLKAEGITQGVYSVGDIMYDSYLHYARRYKPQSKEGGCLVTCHRPVNTDTKQNLHNIVKMINLVAEEMPVYFPIHPRTRRKLEDFSLIGEISKECNILEPLSYGHMLRILQGCDIVMTDSGGLQKEAFFAQKFCITMREETEWPETTACGANFLVSASLDSFLKTFKHLKTLNFHFDKNSDTLCFGDGNTSLKIADILENSTR